MNIFRDIRRFISFKQMAISSYQNKVNIWLKWQSQNGECMEKTVKMDASKFFDNYILIATFTYLSRFGGMLIGSSSEFHDLMKILNDNNLVCYADGDKTTCHSLIDFRVTYFNKNGVPHIVDFNIPASFLSYYDSSYCLKHLSMLLNHCFTPYKPSKYPYDTYLVHQ